jgi:hypothetical protein
VEFGPAIPTSEWSQTHALDRAATGIEKGLRYFSKYIGYIYCFYLIFTVTPYISISIFQEIPTNALIFLYLKNNTR